MSSMRMWRNWNPHTPLVEMSNDAVAFENSPAVPQKVKCGLLPSNSTPRYTPKKNEKVCSQKIVNCSSTVPNSKKRKNTNIHQLMENKKWSIKTRSYYPSMKRNEILIHATTWNLENMMLRKPDTKGHISYDPIYMKYPEQAKSEKQKLRVARGRKN